MSTSPAPAASEQPDVAAIAILTPEGLAACLARELRDATPEDAAIPPREEAVAIFRRYLGRYQADVRTRFEQHVLKGTGAAKTLATFADVMLRAIVDLAVRATGQAASVDLILGLNTGGLAVWLLPQPADTGAGLLAPFSDIDLLFLIAKKTMLKRAHRRGGICSLFPVGFRGKGWPRNPHYQMNVLRKHPERHYRPHCIAGCTPAGRGYSRVYSRCLKPAISCRVCGSRACWLYSGQTARTS
jgi:hypothetical protein